MSLALIIIILSYVPGILAGEERGISDWPAGIHDRGAVN